MRSGELENMAGEEPKTMLESIQQDGTYGCHAQNGQKRKTPSPEPGTPSLLCSYDGDVSNVFRGKTRKGTALAKPP